MRRTGKLTLTVGLTATVFSLLPLIGCKKSTEALIIGSWEGTFAPPGKEGDEKAEIAGKMAKAFNYSVKMRFDADGTITSSTTAMGQELTGQGSWEILSSKGKELRIRTKVTRGRQEDIQEATVIFEDDDTFKLMGGDKPAMVLRRIPSFQ